MATRSMRLQAPSKWSEEVSATARLAWPIVLAQVTQVAIHTTDVVMLGWLGPNALAAAALAINLFFVFNFAGTGLVTACAPLIAAALGQRSNSVRDVRRSVRSAIYAATMFVVPAWLLLWFTESILLAFGQDPQLSSDAARYTWIVQWTLFANLLIMIFRALLSALGRPDVPLMVTVAGLFVNAALNWMLIFGNWGAPQLGLLGAAYATVGTTTLMALLLAIFIAFHRQTRRFYIFGRIWRPDYQRLCVIFRLGTPIGLTMTFEISVFSAAVYLMGHDRVLVRRVEAKRRPRAASSSPTPPRKSRRRASHRRRPGRPRRERQAGSQPLDVKAGDRVLFGKWSGTEVKIDGEGPPDHEGKRHPGHHRLSRKRGARRPLIRFPNPSHSMKEQATWLPKTSNFHATPASACCAASTSSPTR
jgi:co-chaperonin GroES (HSP10)